MIDAGEIVLMADVRIGELTKEMQKAPPATSAGRGKIASPTSGPTKRDALAAEGLTKQQASECERLAAMPRRRFAGRGSPPLAPKAHRFATDHDVLMRLMRI